MQNKESRWSVEITLHIQFYDLDPMEIVWHGNYVKYLEQARCALLDSIGYNYPDMQASGYAWPVIDLHLRYVKPATFGQHITVRASIVAWENSLKIDYLITDKLSGERLTKGTTTQVAVDIATREMCFASPAVLFQKLGIAAP